MSILAEAQLEQALLRCASEPIHQLGRIQPHGALLVVGRDAQRIVRQSSVNLALFIDCAGATALGRPLVDLLGATDASVIEQLIDEIEQRSTARRSISIAKGGELALQARVFPARDAFVIELVKDDRSPHRAELLSGLMLTMQETVLGFDQDRDLESYLVRIAALTREMTGFDRVMVYRFDSNWEGEVIAEQRAASVVSYLGTRFPASDIPAQARQLYLENLVRLVVDVDAEPVAIMPALDPATLQPLDLTLSSLRSLSSVHIEYLRNMGVKASMSISLRQGGRLWGLIACHHLQALDVPSAVLDASRMLSGIASAKLDAMQSLERTNLGAEVSVIVGRLLKNISEDSEEAVLQHLQGPLLELFEASGLVVVVEGRPHRLGEVPDADDLDELLAWLGGLPIGEAFACDDLGHRLPAAARYAGQVSGLLAAPLSRNMRNCMVWLRSERVRSVTWAGSPEKMIRTDREGLVHLSPRRSFQSWTEAWRGRSLPWSLAEIEAGAILAGALTQGVGQKHRVDALQKRQRAIEQRYAMALGATNDGIWDWNLETGKTFTNPAFSRMLGFEPGVLGIDSDTRWLHLVHPDDRDAVDALARQRLRSDGYWECEFRLRCHDGNYKWILSRGKVLEQDLEGVPTHAIGTHSDLSERKRMETQLREAKEAAEASSRAKSSFLANMSHELRTPLNAVMGMTELARFSVDDPETGAQLDQVLGSASQLLTLIDDLLDISRMDDQLPMLESVDFTLDSALAQLDRLIGPRAAQKGLTFRVECDPALGATTFRGDPMRLGQVLVHLAGNAVKFTSRGTIVVRTLLADPDDADSMLRFEVADDGIGIAPEDQDRVFALFEQSDASSTRVHGGSGVGLFLCKRLTSLMGGSIGVKSRVGVGSTFWFTARVALGPDAARSPQTSLRPT
ncbi:MAG: ATP-binding protein [Caldimonas sp.]